MQTHCSGSIQNMVRSFVAHHSIIVLAAHPDNTGEMLERSILSIIISLVNLAAVASSMPNLGIR